MFKRISLFLAVLTVTGMSLLSAEEIQFVFTSDAHYGISRASFRGNTKVDAQIVNRALVASINKLPGIVVPADGGIHAGKPVGAINFVVEGGDIANRQEAGIQNAAASWAQFQADYIAGLTVNDTDGKKAPLYIVPGNHDVSNAIGFHKPMTPATDASSMAEIYNRMMAPAQVKTAATYNYVSDRINYSRDIAGVHFVFITMWPDSVERDWIDRDLKSVAQTSPVIIFCHDQPDIETKHLSNPNGSGDINATNKFENMTADKASVKKVSEPSTKEQQDFAKWLRQHPNVTAYFHGNSNWNQFYDWTGPDGSVVLHTFRVDSPMKGETTATDDSKLSYQLVSIDTQTRLMTVREVLWNSDPSKNSVQNVFGASTTVALYPRPVQN